MVKMAGNNYQKKSYFVSTHKRGNYLLGIKSCVIKYKVFLKVCGNDLVS